MEKVAGRGVGTAEQVPAGVGARPIVQLGPSSGPVRIPKLYLGHFLFENRSLVDFERGNELFSGPGARLLFENRLLVDFQTGNEQNNAPYASFPRFSGLLSADSVRQVPDGCSAARAANIGGWLRKSRTFPQLKIILRVIIYENYQSKLFYLFGPKD